MVLGFECRFSVTVKGKEWYQADDVAEEYDDKRSRRVDGSSIGAKSRPLSPR